MKSSIYELSILWHVSIYLSRGRSNTERPRLLEPFQELDFGSVVLKITLKLTFIMFLPLSKIIIKTDSFFKPRPSSFYKGKVNLNLNLIV